MLQRLARLLLRAGGWTLVGEIPRLRQAVFIIAPHTSNWDGIWLIAYKIAMNVPVRFFAKHTLFRWPLGPFLLRMGAIPVDKTKSGANVDKLTAMFARQNRLLLALAPEGTRKWTPYWRTGFYRIAEAGEVPIVLAFIDYAGKRLGVGPQVDPRVGRDETLRRIRTFYRNCAPARPRNMGPIAFPPEEE